MPSKPSFQSRTALLIGEDGVKCLASSKVYLAGLGGVGGTCFEALVRSGIGSFFLVDGDKVEESNLNRQLLFTELALGSYKVEAAYMRAALINHRLQVDTRKKRIEAEERIDLRGYDLVIDCIDDVGGKLALIKSAIEAEKPILSSLGMGFRLDPSALRAGKMGEVQGDPLAKALRTRARKEGIDLCPVTFVYSQEFPHGHGEDVASMMMVPSAAGLLLAAEAVKALLGMKGD